MQEGELHCPMQLSPESFLLLVKQLRGKASHAVEVEVDLDKMKVKGDLKVIVKSFPDKRFIGRSQSLDLLKRAATAGFHALRMEASVVPDLEFTTLVKNKGTELLKP